MEQSNIKSNSNSKTGIIILSITTVIILFIALIHLVSMGNYNGVRIGSLITTDEKAVVGHSSLYVLFLVILIIPMGILLSVLLTLGIAFIVKGIKKENKKIGIIGLSILFCINLCASIGVLVRQNKNNAYKQSLTEIKVALPGDTNYYAKFDFQIEEYKQINSMEVDFTIKEKYKRNFIFKFNHELIVDGEPYRYYIQQFCEYEYEKKTSGVDESPYKFQTPVIIIQKDELHYTLKVPTTKVIYNENEYYILSYPLYRNEPIMNNEIIDNEDDIKYLKEDTLEKRLFTYNTEKKEFEKTNYKYEIKDDNTFVVNIMKTL